MTVATITDYDLGKLRDTLAYLEAGVIDGATAKRRAAECGTGPINAPDSSRRIIAAKIRKHIRAIDSYRASKA